jgi:hypothetical protein
MPNYDIIQAYSPEQLAHLAGCGAPDSEHSIGGDFLAEIRDRVIAIVKQGGILEEDVLLLVQHSQSVFLHGKWRQFAELEGYKEDLSDYEFERVDQVAGMALQQIGERLAYALTNKLDVEVM